MSEEKTFKVEISGEVAAEALRIAERRLDKLGWKYSAEDVGKHARHVLIALSGART